MKKRFCFILSILILLSVVACKSSKDGAITSLDEVNNKYLSDVVHAGVTAISWKYAAELPPDDFTAFYYHHVLVREFPNGWTEPIKITAEQLEAEVQSHFDVPAEHIRKAANYDVVNQVYLFDYGIGSTEFALIKAEVKDNVLLLYFEYYDKADVTKVIRTGILTLKIDSESFKYVDCSTQES